MQPDDGIMGRYQEQKPVYIAFIETEERLQDDGGIVGIKEVIGNDLIGVVFDYDSGGGVGYHVPKEFRHLFRRRRQSEYCPPP